MASDTSNITLRRRQARSRGNAVLEMGLVLPLLLMLSLGVGEYGYFIYIESTFQGAAQAGARAAIPGAATNASVTTAVGKVMTAAGFPSTSYTLTVNPIDVSTAPAGTLITVTVSSTWGTAGIPILGSTMGAISRSKVIRGTGVMQKEAS